MSIQNLSLVSLALDILLGISVAACGVVLILMLTCLGNMGLPREEEYQQHNGHATGSVEVQVAPSRRNKPTSPVSHAHSSSLISLVW
jgi:hypothetical protein